MTLIKDKFDYDTDISDKYLIVGILPCEATDIILECATNYDIDFYIAMCGFIHSSLSSIYGLYGTSLELYQQQVIDKVEILLKRYPEKKLGITRLSNDSRNYPILYSNKAGK